MLYFPLSFHFISRFFLFQSVPFGTWQNCSVSLLDSVVPSAISLSLFFKPTPLLRAWWPTPAPHYPTFSHTSEVQGRGPGWAGDSAGFITFLPADLTTLASKSSVLSRLIARQLWPPALAGASQSAALSSIPASVPALPFLSLCFPPCRFFTRLSPHRAWTAVSRNTFSSRNDGRDPSTPAHFQ